MSVRQKQGESLRDYVTRFAKEGRKVDHRNDATMLTTFVNGVKPGSFNQILTEHYPTTLERARSSMVGEEADRAKQGYYAHKGQKRNEPRSPQRRWTPIKRQVEFKRRGESSEHNRESRPKSIYNTEELTPLTSSKAHILSVVQGTDVLKNPFPLSTPEWKMDKQRWCEFHEPHGHGTEECHNLAKEIEKVVQRGDVKEFVARQEEPPKEYQRGPQGRGKAPKQEGRQNNPPYKTGKAGDVNVISGGPTHGDSNSAKKQQARSIHFFFQRRLFFGQDYK